MISLLALLKPLNQQKNKDFTRASLLITGGSGLVGKNVAEFFIKKGYKIYTVDLKEKNSKEDVTHIVCDLSKREEIKKLPDKIDYILHFAARIDEKGNSDKEYLLKNNVLSTFNILEYAKSIKVKKFIYASSSAVYGKSGRLSITEDSEKKPDSIYSLSKHFGEQLCNFYSREGLPIISFRLGYVLAPTIPKRYFIYKIMERLINNEEIKIVNGEDNSMSFVDVEDIARFCEEGLESGITGTFNLTGSREIKIKEVIDLLIKCFENYSGKITKEEDDNKIKFSYSNEKLYSVFKSRYIIDIEESIKKIVSDFKSRI